jgi:DNA-binding response OmpR family regulator
MKDLTNAIFFSDARVLVVDDEAEVRSALVRYLGLLGYRVEEASSGHQALKMLRRNTYDAVVLDIRMPGIDGVEVMRRAQDMSPDLPIIFLTGHATLETAIAAVKSHAFDYLRKPASIHDIATAIASALEQRTRGGQPYAISLERFLQSGAVILDQERCLAIVTLPDVACSFGAELTPSETKLLSYLMKRSGTALSCHELARFALDYDVARERAPDIIRPHICRLRQKIEPDPRHPILILTAPGKRYLLTPSPYPTS